MLTQMTRAIEPNNSFLLHVDVRKAEANSSDRGEKQNQADLNAEDSSASSSGRGVEPTASVTSILTVLHIEEEEGDDLGGASPAMLLAQQLTSKCCWCVCTKDWSPAEAVVGVRGLTRGLLKEGGVFLLAAALRHGSLFSGSSAQMASSPKSARSYST